MTLTLRELDLKNRKEEYRTELVRRYGMIYLPGFLEWMQVFKSFRELFVPCWKRAKNWTGRRRCDWPHLRPKFRASRISWLIERAKSAALWNPKAKPKFASRRRQRKRHPSLKNCPRPNKSSSNTNRKFANFERRLASWRNNSIRWAPTSRIASASWPKCPRNAIKRPGTWWPKRIELFDSRKILKTWTTPSSRKKPSFRDRSKPSAAKSRTCRWTRQTKKVNIYYFVNL